MEPPKPQTEIEIEKIPSPFKPKEKKPPKYLWRVIIPVVVALLTLSFIGVKLVLSKINQSRGPLCGNEIVTKPYPTPTSTTSTTKEFVSALPQFELDYPASLASVRYDSETTHYFLETEDSQLNDKDAYQIEIAIEKNQESPSTPKPTSTSNNEIINVSEERYIGQFKSVVTDYRGQGPTHKQYEFMLSGYKITLIGYGYNHQLLDNTAYSIKSTAKITDKNLWNEYHDNGFSFKYPSSIKLENNSARVAGPTTGKSTLIADFFQENTMLPNTNAPINGFSIYRIEKAPQTSFSNWLKDEIAAKKQSPSGIKSEQIHNLKISGLNAAFIDYEGDIKLYFIQTPYPKTIIAFAETYVNPDFEINFDEIIQTFKLDNQSSKNPSSNLFESLAFSNGRKFTLKVPNECASYHKDILNCDSDQLHFTLYTPSNGWGYAGEENESTSTNITLGSYNWKRTKTVIGDERYNLLKQNDPDVLIDVSYNPDSQAAENLAEQIIGSFRWVE